MVALSNLLFASIAVAISASAMAQCTSYPNPLTNGNLADATQVTADLNYMAGCLAPLANPHLTGNVGIGTTAPSETLHIFGTGLALSNTSPNYYYKIASNESQAQFNIGYYGSGNWYPNSGTPAVTLTYTGLLGIGTTTPSDSLDVNGATVFGSVGGPRLSVFYDDIGFNRQVATGAIYSSSAYAYQITHVDSTTALSDALVLEVYAPSGAGVSNALVINGIGNVGVNGVSPLSYNF